MSHEQQFGGYYPTDFHNFFFIDVFYFVLKFVSSISTSYAGQTFSKPCSTYTLVFVCGITNIFLTICDSGRAS